MAPDDSGPLDLIEMIDIEPILDARRVTVEYNRTATEGPPDDSYLKALLGALGLEWGSFPSSSENPMAGEAFMALCARIDRETEGWV